MIWEPASPDDRAALRAPALPGVAVQNLAEHARGNRFLRPDEIAAAPARAGLTPEVHRLLEGREAIVVAREPAGRSRPPEASRVRRRLEDPEAVAGGPEPTGDRVRHGTTREPVSSPAILDYPSRSDRYSWLSESKPSPWPTSPPAAPSYVAATSEARAVLESWPVM